MTNLMGRRGVPLAPENMDMLPVVVGVPVADPPNPKYKIDLQALPDVVEISVPTIQNATPFRPWILTTDDGALSIMDKPHPHALYEVMLMQAARQVHSSIAELSTGERNLLLATARRFAAFVADPHVQRQFGLEGALLRMSVNHDPWTLDRPGMQPVSRLHVHMYLLDAGTVRIINQNRQPYGTLVSPFQQKQLVDPLSFLGAALLRDLHYAHLVRLPSDMTIDESEPRAVVEQALPLGLNIRIESGWSAFADEHFSAYLCELHHAMCTAANEIFAAFTGESPVAPLGVRHPLYRAAEIGRRLNRISWISGRTRDGLNELANWLRDVPTSLFDADHHAHWLVQHVVLNGLAYALSFAAPTPLGCDGADQAIWLNVSNRLFSNVGGAGLFGCTGASAVLLDRGRGTRSDVEMASRWDFQRAFAGAVRENVDELLVDTVATTAGNGAHTMRQALVP